MASIINAATSGGLVTSADTSGVLQLQTASTTAVTVTASQNVGIGTSSPAQKLDVSSTSDAGFALSNSSSLTSGNRGNIYMLNSANSTVGLIRFGAVTDNVGTEMQFYTRPAAGSLTQTMTLSSAGNLGIGTSSPSTPLDVTKAGGANFVATFQNTTAGTPYCVFIKDAASSAVGYPLLAVTDSTGSSTYFRVDSSAGTVGIGTTPNSSASDGVLKISNGITFPATQSASSNANTLDDYEEGTFTPTAFGETTAGTTTYVVQQGTYEKIGRFVHVEVSLQVSNMTGTGKLLLGGLPFTVAAAPDAVAGTVGKVASLNFTGQLGLMCLGATTYSRVIGISSGSGYTQQDVDTAFEFTYSISYHV